MSRYNRCGDCYNMKCVFATGERTDFDSSECIDFRPMTNADRIRAMTDDELAEFLKSVHFVDVLWCLRWLKSPVEVDE